MKYVRRLISFLCDISARSLAGWGVTWMQSIILLVFLNTNVRPNFGFSCFECEIPQTTIHKLRAVCEASKAASAYDWFKRHDKYRSCWRQLLYAHKRIMKVFNRPTVRRSFARTQFQKITHRRDIFLSLQITRRTRRSFRCFTQDTPRSQ